MEESKLRQQSLKHLLAEQKLKDVLTQHELLRTSANQAVDAEDAEMTGTLSADRPQTTLPAERPQTTLLPLQTPSLATGMTQRITDSLRGGPPSATPLGPVPAGSSPAPAPIAAPPLMQPVATHAVAVDPSSGMPTVNFLHDELPTQGYRMTPAHEPVTASGEATHVGAKKAGHVWLPPIQIPEMGIDVPGQWFSARAAREESARRAIALKRAEQPGVVVPPGNTFLEVSQKTGQHEPVYTNTNPRPGETPEEAYNRAVKAGDTAEAQRILEGIVTVTKARTHDSRFEEGKQIYAKSVGGDSFDKLTVQQQGAFGQWYERWTTDQASKDIAHELARARLSESQQRLEDARANRAQAEQNSAYRREVEIGHQRYVDAVHARDKKIANGADAVDVPDVPEYQAPSFETWQAQHPVTAPTAVGKPVKAGTTPSPPKAGQTIDVTLPDGTVAHFKTQAEVEAFAKLHGLTVK